MFYITHLKLKFINVVRIYLLPSISFFLFALGRLTYVAGNKPAAFKIIMLSHRVNPTDLKTDFIRRNIDNILNYLDCYINDNVKKETAATRSIVLKEPKERDGKVDKGVLLITFTATLGYFYHHVNIRKLLENYYLVLEPSSAGYCDPLLLFLTQYPDPVIVQATELSDRRFLSKLNSNLKPVDFGASDWVDHTTFKPLEGANKIYDSVCVANYTSIKRLEYYLRALRSIKKIRQNYKAAIVCAKWGEHRNYYLELIKKFQLKEMIDVFESLDKIELNQILNQAKVSILLSHKEGSNRSLFESIFANTPVIALKNNVGINKEYINKHTGKLIHLNQLATALLDFKENFTKYNPRKWAMKNISPEATTEKLKHSLSKFTGLNIDQFPLYVKTNNPEVSYFNQSPIDKFTFNLEMLNTFRKY